MNRAERAKRELQAAYDVAAAEMDEVCREWRREVDAAVRLASRIDPANRFKFRAMRDREAKKVGEDLRRIFDGGRAS
jgi:hypothetical protein